MTKPRRFLIRMLVFLAAVGGVVAALHSGLEHAFFANAPLNGLIIGVFLLGVIYNIRQVLSLGPEVAWIERYRGDRRTGDAGLAGTAPVSAAPPHLLAPMAAMLGERKGRLQLSAPAMRSLLDGIASRLDESRDLSRYVIGLLIFLGLLGTFWGLSQTIGAIGDVIRGLQVGGGDVGEVFESLKRGLGVPLSGMGTAFSSSLFGLGGSVVLGFLDLQAGQAQNRFFNDLEEWLSGSTRLSSGALPGDGEQSMPVYVQALLEQTAESLETLQRTLTRGEEARIATNTHIMGLAEKIGTLTDQMRAEQQLMLKLGEGQAELRPILARLAEAFRAPQAGGMDDATRGHIRNLDVYVARLIEEMIAGREEIVRQVRSDIKLLARTIAAVADEAGRQG
ncbi:MAG: flagellar motor protein MotA [Rhodospirillales bacterium]|nr:flagellar motor protein MotA [Rhodospirillales bacterium]